MPSQNEIYTPRSVRRAQDREKRKQLFTQGVDQPSRRDFFKTGAAILGGLVLTGALRYSLCGSEAEVAAGASEQIIQDEINTLTIPPEVKANEAKNWESGHHSSSKKAEYNQSNVNLGESRMVSALISMAQSSNPYFAEAGQNFLEMVRSREVEVEIAKMEKLLTAFLVQPAFTNNEQLGWNVRADFDFLTSYSSALSLADSFLYTYQIIKNKKAFASTINENVVTEKANIITKHYLVAENIIEDEVVNLSKLAEGYIYQSAIMGKVYEPNGGAINAVAAQYIRSGKDAQNPDWRNFVSFLIK